ncbi:MAG TPA: Hsp20/alpha crystallin family protein [Planctomycetaceae bacterium]|nr:Hsp20/alpha crystallin family protein [Planctomycetaceae bacterium]
MNLIPFRRKREQSEVEPTPETSLARLRREMDALFDRFFRQPWDLWGREWPTGGWISAPRTDLADSADEVTVTMELPGIDPKDVDISISGDMLTVRGEKRAESEEKKRDYHYVERQFCSFQRTVQLPSTVDPEKVDASYRNGVLTIRVAKHPGARPRKIRVRHA